MFDGTEFVVKETQEWLASARVRRLSIPRETPWDNGYVECFNGRLREKLFDGE